MNILAVGDIVGYQGIDFFVSNINSVKKQYNADFVIVNAENVRGVGIFPDDAEKIYNAGADAITLGNHAFKQHQIRPFLNHADYILRPYNCARQIQGRGFGIYKLNGISIKVVSLIGSYHMKFECKNPFFEIDELINNNPSDITVIDFHAEGTGEKCAMGFYLDGRCSAIFGTHTHIQTADERILPKGTGYITDVGMTGVYNSVLGVKAQDSIALFKGNPPERLSGADGKCMLCGAVFSINESTGLCTDVKRILIKE